MYKLIFFLLFFIQLSLESAEFVLFTQPKTGTHLLIPILTELTQKKVYWAPEYAKNVPLRNESYEEACANFEYLLFDLRKMPWTKQTMDLVWANNRKNNTYLHLHAPYSPAMENYLADKNAICFYIKRDPRDQIVSLLNHYKNINFNDKDVELLPTDDERLLYMIRKESREQTIHFMNWLNSKVCCILEFEKLMGDHGGSATHDDAMNELKKVVSVLQLKLSDEEIERVYKKNFGHGWNFFKGKVGAWKDYFNEEHKAAMKEEIGDLLIQLGYEKDLGW